MSVRIGLTALIKMMEIKDIISYIRFSDDYMAGKKVTFGYYDRILKTIIYRDFEDIEKFDGCYFYTFNEYDSKDMIIPHTRIREFIIDDKLIWWRHPESNINDYGCTIR